MADAWVLVAILAAAGALAAGATALSRPLVALGILFFLASISSVTLETPVGMMRLEQPAIAVVALVLLVNGRFRSLLSLPRSIGVIAMAFAAFLVALTLSSAFVASDPLSSLRIVAWFAISMVGGIVAFILVQPRPVAAMKPLAFAGAAKGAVGLTVAALFLIAGPAFDLGIQEANTVLPRVQGFTWEANLYASFLATCVPFALEAARSPRRWIGMIMLVLVVVGLPLGETRGAYLGVIAGLVVYFVVRFWWERRPADLWRLAGITATAAIVGLIASNTLLPNALERQIADSGRSEAPSGSPAVSGSGGPYPSPTISLAPYPDTVGFRLDRIPIALRDLPMSPFIGLGAESFGQRHLDPSQNGKPDHLAILAVAAIYDAGIGGGAALAIGFVLVFVGLWRAAGAASRAGDRHSVGAAAAFMGSLAALLISYQATNALHFAVNWIIVGAGVALIAHTLNGPVTNLHPASGDTPSP